MRKRNQNDRNFHLSRVLCIFCTILGVFESKNVHGVQQQNVGLFGIFLQNEKKFREHHPIRTKTGQKVLKFECFSLLCQSFRFR